MTSLKITTMHQANSSTMHTITLYRIKKAEWPQLYQVSQAYRMFTQVPMELPSNYALQGVMVPEDHVEWFEKVVIPVVEKNNGDYIIDKWAVPHDEDPEHVTVCMTLNDVIVAPDILNNTTSFMDGPKQQKRAALAILGAVKEFEKERHITLPNMDEKWMVTEEVHYISRLMKNMLQLP